MKSMIGAKRHWYESALAMPALRACESVNESLGCSSRNAEAVRKIQSGLIGLELVKTFAYFSSEK